MIIIMNSYDTGIAVENTPENRRFLGELLTGTPVKRSGYSDKAIFLEANMPDPSNIFSIGDIATDIEAPSVKERITALEKRLSEETYSRYKAERELKTAIEGAS